MIFNNITSYPFKLRKIIRTNNYHLPASVAAAIGVMRMQQEVHFTQAPRVNAGKLLKRQVHRAMNKLSTRFRSAAELSWFSADSDQTRPEL